MDPLSRTISSAFTRYFQAFDARVHVLAGDLTEDEFWSKPYPYGNSFGHLVLHITGNLSYYIGTQIAGTGYVRDREREFTDPARRPKEHVLRALDATVAMVVRTLEGQNSADWARSYDAVGVDDQNRFSIVLRCAEHFHHHLGQMIYLSKEHSRRRA